MARLLRRPSQYPIFTKILFANSIIILIGAVGGTQITRRFAERSGFALTLMFLAVGLALTLLANYFLLRAAFRPLGELTRAMEGVRKGELQRRVPEELFDPYLRRVSRSFNEMLDRLETETLGFSARLLESIEEERRRIGRELHDETSQSLATVLINLQLAEKGLGGRLPEVREHVAVSKDLIQHSLTQIKLLVYDLRPSMLDDFGLVPALRWYIESYLGATGIAIETDFEEGGRRLPGEVETALYRIAQEALANVAKHSQATRATVRLETQPGFATLEVTDNGKGFRPDQVVLNREIRHGIGLPSIRERVEVLDGTVTIDSRPGGGTSVHVVIPFDRSVTP